MLGIRTKDCPLLHVAKVMVRDMSGFWWVYEWAKKKNQRNPIFSCNRKIIQICQSKYFQNRGLYYEPDDHCCPQKGILYFCSDRGRVWTWSKITVMEDRPLQCIGYSQESSSIGVSQLTWWHHHPCRQESRGQQFTHTKEESERGAFHAFKNIQRTPNEDRLCDRYNTHRSEKRRPMLLRNQNVGWNSNIAKIGIGSRSWVENVLENVGRGKGEGLYEWRGIEIVISTHFGRAYPRYEPTSSSRVIPNLVRVVSPRLARRSRWGWQRSCRRTTCWWRCYTHRRKCGGIKSHSCIRARDTRK